MEWIKIKNAFFEQDPKNNIEQGWMSLEDGKKKVLAQPDKAIGLCVQQGDDEESLNICVIKIGTPKYENPNATFDCYVYKKSLPDEDLYEDDFAEDSWGRPGRGEGLADAVRELSLFSGVDPNDLGQGGLGDCWLISALSALAEFPEHIMSIFDRKTIALDGKYTITLYSYEDNAPIQIEIDDRFPIRGGNFANVHMTDAGEIWPCLIEKAFAKYSGGYEELEGGQSIFAFGALTGCTDLVYYSRQEDDEWTVLPAKYTSNKVHEWEGAYPDGTKTDAEMFAELAQFDASNFLMCCGSASGSDSDTNSSGVVQGHAYTLLSVKGNCAGSGHDLLCLRNPWGQSEWTGDWCDASELWDENPEVAAECGHTEDDDGMFWISWEDFFENYKSVYVCKKGMGDNRGKAAIQENKTAIKTGTIEDKPKKESRGLAANRKKNMSFCPIC